MKKQTHSILIIAALILTVLSSVRAQSAHLIEGNIPFNFVIRDRALPAGEYRFALIQIGGSDLLKIQSADGHITAIVPTRSAYAKGGQAEPKLVFNRYEDQYFLVLVYGLEENSEQRLVRSPAEDVLATRASAPRRRTEVITARKR